MRRRIFTFVSILILFSFHCTQISNSFSKNDPQTPEPELNTLKYPNIDILTKSLKLITKNRGKGSQVFYISGIFDSYFYLYWKNRKAVYILRSIENDLETNYVDSIRFPTGSSRIQIDTNVVETLDEVGGSTFLIHRDSLNSILEKCLNGILIRI
ncbi:hypothetical protein A0128_15650 [Leptospira tipperaryensis]|uniref:Lipoprotein n=1 Tax=Leptospira tipperaryensis TaxID=2564040 RepID=A0A1D7UZZ5_9LEPT|nr:hypothetical protein [Leptospira tipperaryensis]AOP35147.1 hypothetical protein A0128_15650 [Leptospira tipperaryensis]